MQKYNAKIWSYFRKRESAGAATFICRGGRRSGKTYAICQLLTMLAYQEGDVVNVASMTKEQGRMGAYEDFCTIIRSDPTFEQAFTIGTSPLVITCKKRVVVDGVAKYGRIFFNSYKDSETAKGIACDDIFINEANKFSRQQYSDLRVNVRKRVFLDFNPKIIFWANALFDESDFCDTTWQDNIDNLPEAQRRAFEEMKERAERPDASAEDIRIYNVDYLGKYAEASGKIFMEHRLHFEDKAPDGLKHIAVFCDPSALRGADFFACVLSGVDDEGRVWVLDTFSMNAGNREVVINQLRKWGSEYDRVAFYTETNGLVGLDFYEYAHKSGLHVEGWNSRQNKWERIVANYQNICERVVFVNTPTLPSFMRQVYDFDRNCEHDDNIDALVSSYLLHALMGHLRDK